MYVLNLSDAETFALANIIAYWEVLAFPTDEVKNDLDKIRNGLYKHSKDILTSFDKQDILSQLGNIKEYLP